MAWLFVYDPSVQSSIVHGSWICMVGDTRLCGIYPPASKTRPRAVWETGRRECQSVNRSEQRLSVTVGVPVPCS